MDAYSIAGINSLPPDRKRDIFVHMIPDELFESFNLTKTLIDENGNSLLTIKGRPGEPSLETFLYHEHGFEDPLIYSHLADTLNGQIHVLLYILNDPASPRFDVDRLPDGQKTVFGTQARNVEAEILSMEAGLAPGQVRRGLRMLSKAILTFENFVTSLGHDIYFIEPLFYHNAVIFENYGFAYQKGIKLMERIQGGFSSSGDLITRLDSSSPFRKREFSTSIRLRSWSIHDGILGEPFSKVTMYKYVGKKMSVNTCFDCIW